MNAIRVLLILAAATCFVGCATTGNYEKVLQTWIGQSEDALIRGWGTPAQSYKTSSGQKVISYYKSNGSSSTLNRGTMYTPASVMTTEVFCKTDFYLTETGVVSYWRWEGNACRARDPAGVF